MGVKLSPEKFRHKQRAVKYVGHILSARESERDPRKVAAIINMDIPKSRADLQRFLGMVTYLGKFMSRLSELCAPLRDLLQEKTEWLWTSEADEAVAGIKKPVSSTPVLKYFDKTKRVHTDPDAVRSKKRMHQPEPRQNTSPDTFRLQKSHFRLGGVEKELQSTRKERKDPPHRKNHTAVDEES